MSAFHVSNDHINYLLSWARRNNPIVRSHDRRFDISQSEHYWRVGVILREANSASMEARYGDEPVMYEAQNLPALPAINIVAGCDCLAYQSCEYDGWEKSDAKCILDQIRDAAIRSVPGYEGHWELNRERFEVAA
jgi:hypothetical protein